MYRGSLSAALCSKHICNPMPANSQKKWSILAGHRLKCSVYYIRFSHFFWPYCFTILICFKIHYTVMWVHSISFTGNDDTALRHCCLTNLFLQRELVLLFTDSFTSWNFNQSPAYRRRFCHKPSLFLNNNALRYNCHK